MHYIRLPKSMLLASLLTFVFLTLSASTSSCDYGAVPTGCGSTDYQCMARQDAFKAGIPMETFVIQIEAESSFRPEVISSEGAIGIAQIMPATAAGWNVNPRDPVASLKAAADHMALYDKRYSAYYSTHYAMALGCYNAGCGRVDWAIQNCSYWLLCMPFETQRYVKKIMGY